MVCDDCDKQRSSILAKMQLNRPAVASPRWPPIENLQCKREEKLRALFKAREGQPQLEVIRVTEGCSEAGNERKLSIELENVSDSSRLKELSQAC